jgi:carboxyl-terminal processing protease
LPWSEVKPAKYKRLGDIKSVLPQLQSLHDARVKDDPEFQQFVEDIAVLKAQREKTELSLNETERRNEMTAEENRLKSRKKSDDGLSSSPDDGLQSNERSLSADIEKTRKNAKDVLQTEAAGIVANLSDLQVGAKAASK